MSVADILRDAGFVPVVPALSRTAGTAETLIKRTVPLVPAENNKGAVEPGRLWRGRGKRPDTELVARVRQRFVEACKRLSIDPAPVLRQFDCWRYTGADLQEMDAWPTSTVMQHCLLLRDEIAAGVKP